MKVELTPKSEEEILSHLEELSSGDLLQKSSEIGFLPGVKRALERGANVHAMGDLALRLAAGYGHKEVVEVLLKAGANVHAEDDYALRGASANGHKDAVELLLRAGANVHAGADGALRLASRNGHKEVVELLLKAASIKFSK